MPVAAGGQVTAGSASLKSARLGRLVARRYSKVKPGQLFTTLPDSVEYRRRSQRVDLGDYRVVAAGDGTGLHASPTGG